VQAVLPVQALAQSVVAVEATLYLTQSHLTVAVVAVKELSLA
jgi:hypothetical protein